MHSLDHLLILGLNSTTGLASRPAASSCSPTILTRRMHSSAPCRCTGGSRVQEGKEGKEGKRDTGMSWAAGRR